MCRILYEANLLQWHSCYQGHLGKELLYTRAVVDWQFYYICITLKVSGVWCSARVVKIIKVMEMSDSTSYKHHVFWCIINYIDIVSFLDIIHQITQFRVIVTSTLFTAYTFANTYKGTRFVKYVMMASKSSVLCKVKLFKLELVIVTSALFNISGS